MKICAGELIFYLFFQLHAKCLNYVLCFRHTSKKVLYNIFCIDSKVLRICRLQRFLRGNEKKIHSHVKSSSILFYVMTSQLLAVTLSRCRVNDGFAKIFLQRLE